MNEYKDISTKIVNMINEDYRLHLFTVDLIQMIEDVSEILEKQALGLASV